MWLICSIDTASSRVSVHYRVWNVTGLIDSGRMQEYGPQQIAGNRVVGVVYQTVAIAAAASLSRLALW